MTLTNDSGSAVSSWTVEITVPSGFEITSGWNGKYTVSGTKLTVKNESYNGEIVNGRHSRIRIQLQLPHGVQAR